MKNQQEFSNMLKSIDDVRNELQKVIIGQSSLIDSLLLAILSNGHVILEGVPGLAKTMSVETLSRALNLDYKRISFTPDLLPGDLLGGEIYNQQESKFYIKKGPIFTNFLLADEINRAPSKVQSALLEAMQENKITIGEETFSLKKPFFVFATQNPIEQEGTYNLPEAQLDRFLLKVVVSYPKEEEEIRIMKSNFSIDSVKISKILNSKEIISLQEYVENNVFLDDKISAYIKDIVFASRDPKRFNLSEISNYLDFGLSPRASIGLYKASKSRAFLSGRDYVVPDDVKEVAFEVLRHRIGLSFEALGEEITSDFIINKILEKVIVP